MIYCRNDNISDYGLDSCRKAELGPEPPVDGTPPRTAEGSAGGTTNNLKWKVYRSAPVARCRSPTPTTPPNPRTMICTAVQRNRSDGQRNNTSIFDGATQTYVEARGCAALGIRSLVALHGTISPSFAVSCVHTALQTKIKLWFPM